MPPEADPAAGMWLFLGFLLAMAIGYVQAARESWRADAPQRAEQEEFRRGMEECRKELAAIAAQKARQQVEWAARSARLEAARQARQARAAQVAHPEVTQQRTKYRLRTR